MSIWIYIVSLLSALIVLIYIGYPVLLKLGALGAARPISRELIEPTISIIVPAHNEEGSIEQKIENLLALDYPKDRIEVLVGSDGSTDNTENIVRRFASAGVQLITSDKQLGKSGIQNLAVAAAHGDILVFTDADCILAPDSLVAMVANFADPRVGLVTCSPAYSNRSENQITQNEGLYWRYENWIRSEESRRGLLTTASGWLFGMRRSLWKPLDLNVGDDFVLPLITAIHGFRNVVDVKVHVVSRLAQAQTHSMFRMKMRIVSKDMRGLWNNRSILNPFRLGSVAISIWLHKLLRWLVPYFLSVLFLANLFLLAHPLFLFFLGLQAAFYAVALCCLLIGEDRVHAPWSIALSFCLVNSAALVGSLHFAAGKKFGTWRPVR
jgi:cellulose synthase/poly-beta-1,6-N-acetylglucosamine synthase-like glycosyltransferase